MNPYILNCRCFADAMNQLRFPLHVPEYYEPAIPSYFRQPIDNPKPIVNGEEVEWEEYMESHDVTPPKSIIPNMIYKAEDLNQAYSMKTPVDIMDLIDNEVEFTFVRFQDVELVINIFDGYAVYGIKEKAVQKDEHPSAGLSVLGTEASTEYVKEEHGNEQF